MKNILLIGPIGDFGGREIEVNQIVGALKEKYILNVFSTSHITKNSFALKLIQPNRWSSLERELYKNKWIIKVLSVFSYLFNDSSKTIYGHVNNRLSKKIFNLDNLFKNILKKEIYKYDLIFLCVQPSSAFLEYIITNAKNFKIPVIIRTVGHINLLDKQQITSLKKADLFIHHSKQNILNLNKQFKHNYIQIDQYANSEEKLLKLPIKVSEPVVYGYLGRFSKEKGIVRLLEYFSNKPEIIYVMGAGPQENEIKKIVSKTTNCHFLGSITVEELAVFFSKIDVLIIPSLEEAGPLVGLEAMAAGKIIISTKVGAMMERINDENYPFWFNIEEPITLDKCINKLNDMDFGIIKKMMKEMRLKYKEKYKKENIHSKYLSSINNFLN